MNGIAGRNGSSVFSRYRLAKLWNAAEDFLHELGAGSTGIASHQQHAGHAAQASSNPASTSFTDALTAAKAKFWSTYNQQMTRHMYIAGVAMAPALNKAAISDRDACEKLVIRTIPRPSSRNVLVGDVVALNSPLPLSHTANGQEEVEEVLIRRVAATEGDELVAGAGSDDEEVMEVPSGHCWVLADNPDLKPHQVYDSRTFGHVPMSSIIGRVIFAGNSPKDGRKVENNPASMDDDEPVIEAEVNVEQLFSNNK